VTRNRTSARRTAAASLVRAGSQQEAELARRRIDQQQRAALGVEQVARAAGRVRQQLIQTPERRQAPIHLTQLQPRSTVDTRCQ
jgi:hypothetical protein